MLVAFVSEKIICCDLRRKILMKEALWNGVSFNWEEKKLDFTSKWCV